jgi:hypothetical protein
MIRGRLFAIACGYKICDDLDVLRFRPAFKLARDTISTLRLSHVHPR